MTLREPQGRRLRQAQGKAGPSEARVLRLGHLYPSLMNVYGDRGNIICLTRRCEARGIRLDVTPLEIGDAFDF